MAEVEVVPESDSLALRGAEKGSHDWAIKNYSILKGIGGVDQAIESDKFTVGGHRWMLRLFPDGKTYKARDVFNSYLLETCLLNQSRNVTVFTHQIRVSLPSIKVPESNIGAHLGKLLESEKGADVFFSVSGARFSAHKWILSARSTVFRSMLLDQHPQPQQIITIPDMDPKIFKELLS